MIVWGPPGPEQEAAKKAGKPRVTKRFTSELGCVTPVILVPGQVPTDAALSFAPLQPTANLALLHAVRAAHPEAHVVYKVHPDIVARMRAEKESLAQVREFCDEVVGDVNMAELLAEVDAVHVLTSLTGFEALLRGLPVTCHGRPFYSGWGLTHDLAAGSDRRQRKLTLDQLVAGALILYPVYLDRSGPGLITPEQALDALASRQRRREPPNEWWQGAYRMALRRVVGVR
jgi:capsular polysaccharide export protein